MVGDEPVISEAFLTTFVLLGLLLALLGGFARRVAGGVLGDDWHIWRVPHLLAVLFWGFIGGIAGFAGTHNWIYALIAGVGLWLGHILGLHHSAGMGWITKPTASLTSDELAAQARWHRRFMNVGSIWMDNQPVPATAEWVPAYFIYDLGGMLLYGVSSVALAALFVGFCPLGAGLRLLPLALGAAAVPCIYAFTTWVWARDPVGATTKWTRGFGPSLGLAEWIAGGVLVGAIYV